MNSRVFFPDEPTPDVRAWPLPWWVGWVGQDGVERRRECRTRTEADSLVFDLMSSGRASDVTLDGARQ